MNKKKHFVIQADGVDDVKISLKRYRETIYKNGLDDVSFYNILDMVLSNTEIDAHTQTLMFESLIPQSIVSEEATRKLVLWFFSNAYNKNKSVKSVLIWISTLLKYKLINVDELGLVYNQYIKYLHISDYLVPLSKIIIDLTQPKNVTNSNIYLLEKCYEAMHKNHSIGNILRTYYQCCPHLVPECYKTIKLIESGNMSQFEIAILNSSQRLGLTKNEKKAIPVYSGCLPKYDLNDPTGKKFSDIKSMEVLGKCIQNLVEPENPLSLLSSKEGIMYLIIKGPSDNFHKALHGALIKPTEALLHSLIELQNGLMNGLPQIFDYLSTFLISWDGIKNLDIICGLIPWLYFNTLNELNNNILKPLFRVIVFSSVETQSKLFRALTDFLVNLISVQIVRHEAGKSETPEWLKSSHNTFINLAINVNKFINHAILLENEHFLILVSEALTFNSKMLLVGEEFKIDCFIVIPAVAVYYALFSANFSTLSELCCLMTSYKQNLIPRLSALGVLDNFNCETEQIENYGNNIFTYIWRLKADDAISILNEETNPTMLLISKTVERKHLGIFPLLEFMMNKAGGSVNSEKKALLSLFEYFAEHIAKFIKLKIEEEKENEAATSE